MSAQGGSAARAAGPAPLAAAPDQDDQDVKNLNIGEVLGRLRDEYPDVTLSKIRFLEAEGLVEPARTSANYRKYSADDVERLRYVLRAQRDEYLPLRVIKDQLAALDRDPAAPRSVPRATVRPLAAVPPPVADLVGTDPAAVRLSRRDLLAAADLSDADLTELERAGLLAPPAGSSYYDGVALVVARTASELARFGIGPRHLRGFRAAADREVGLVLQGAPAAAGSRDPGAAGRASEGARELAGLCVQLHAALLEGGLRATRGR